MFSPDIIIVTFPATLSPFCQSGSHISFRWSQSIMISNETIIIIVPSSCSSCHSNSPVSSCTVHFCSTQDFISWSKLTQSIILPHINFMYRSPAQWMTALTVILLQQKNGYCVFKGIFALSLLRDTKFTKKRLLKRICWLSWVDIYAGTVLQVSIQRFAKIIVGVAAAVVFRNTEG